MPAEFDREAAKDRLLAAAGCNAVVNWDDLFATFDAELAAAERAAREAFAADVRTHLRCNCETHGYVKRHTNSRTYSECPWHAYAIELLTDEEFAASPAARTGGRDAERAD